MEAEPVREMQLLDDEDDVVAPSDMNGIESQQTMDRAHFSSNVKVQSNSSNLSMSINSKTSYGNTTNNNNGTSSSTSSKTKPIVPPPPLQKASTLGRPSTLSKFKISPNDPNANYQKKMELKSIARPRSRSSSRFNSPSSQIGIEQYVEMYSSQSQLRSSSQSQLEKITMNLKMDDLLSNVKNENNSYQTLSELSFLHADADAIGAENQMYCIKKGKRTRSLENTNMADSDWLNTRINDIKQLNSALKKTSGDPGQDGYEDNDEDSPDSDSNEDILAKPDDSNNVKYKYTASYKKDETGSFKEQSKIVFESKYAAAAKAVGISPTSESARNRRATNNDDNEPLELDDAAKQQAKKQIADMLALLHGNVVNLEQNLDKIDSVAKVIMPYVHDPADGPEHVHIPVPKTINKLRADPKISNLESNIGAGISLIKNIMSDTPGQQAKKQQANSNPFGFEPNAGDAVVTTLTTAAGGDGVTVYKKSNDQFFNDFLSKSDDLLAQTQSKLEKLGKLDTISKPIPAPPKPEPKPEKPIPRATITKPPEDVSLTPPTVQPQSASKIITKAELKTAAANNTSLFPTSHQQQQVDQLNNSKSLIDLNSWDTPVEPATEASTTTTVTKVEPENQMVDLLFDMSETSLGFGLTNTTLKQNESFVDLLGLQTSESASNLQQQEQSSSTAMPFPKELLTLDDMNGVSQSISTTSLTSFKDTMLYDMVGSMEKIDNLNHNTPDKTSHNNTNNNSMNPKINEIVGLYSSTPAAKSSFYENMSAINEVEEPEATPLPCQQPEPQWTDDLQAPSIDITITEPANEMNDSNIVPDDLFDIGHEKPVPGSRSSSQASIAANQQHNTINTAHSLVNLPLASNYEATMTEEQANITSGISTSLNNLDSFEPSAPVEAESSSTASRENIAQSKPLSVVSNQLPLALPTLPAMPSPSIARSRPQVAKPSDNIALPRPAVSTASIVSDCELFMSELEGNLNVTDADGYSNKGSPMPARKQNKIKVRSYKTTKTGEQQPESSSSSDNDDDDEQTKFQIRIRPKSMRKAGHGQAGCDSSAEPFKMVPLLPKPPKNAEEIEELRQRRISESGGESCSRSVFASAANSDSDEDMMKVERTPDTTKPTTVSASSEGGKAGRRMSRNSRQSIYSEYNLEMPDEDDNAPLSDFNDKCELKRYSDGSYGCMVLVRQPFPNAQLMYKNVLAKMTEVRAWTECLVKLIDSGPNNKRLVFYNAHELMTLAAEHEITLDDVIAKAVVNKDDTEKPVHNPRDFYADDTLQQKPTEPQQQEPEKQRELPKILPFHEIELKASYKFSDLSLQQMDVFSKIHTFKIQEIIFKETLTLRQDRLLALPDRFMKRFTKPKAGSLIDHTPIPFEIVKFGHMDHKYLRSFLLLLQDAFWQLPTITRKLQREQQLAQLHLQPVTAFGQIQSAASSIFNFGAAPKQVNNPSLNSVVSSHAQEQITVKVIDEYKCKLDRECRILEHRCRTRVLLSVFLNDPNPIIEIGMNDCLRHGKEIVGRHDIIPIKTEQWISPEIFELNENVLEREEFGKTHCLKCEQMPDNLSVEIMRFRTRPRRNYELPLRVQCYMSLIGRQCEIRIECTVAGTYFSKISDQHCEDIQIRFPLPDAWVYMFRVEKMFRYGAVHSTKHKFGKIKGLDRFMVHKSQHQGAIMEASAGMAKYEQAFRSLVWRIEQLPVKNKDIYKTHLFICKMNLQDFDKIPDDFEKVAQAQYSVSQICAASKSQVRSISVNTCEDPPEKWVKLKSKFEYDLAINYAYDENALPAVDQEKCAELQHLQSESDMDNNTEDDFGGASDKD